jgi:hypothetical protein
MSDDPARRPDASGPRPALVDGHVHFHPGFDERRFFVSAAGNLENAARELDLADGWEGVLVLTEVAGRSYFGELQGRASAEASGDSVHGLLVLETSEELSVRIAGLDGGRTLTVVGGRQIQTSEGLEVLAFPMREEVPDGLPVRTALEAVGERLATGVIPWGPGKWSLRRGRVLEALLHARRGGELAFLLADTGHRPTWAALPTALRLSDADGRPRLTGSDPLPLWGEASRAGSCCFEIVLEGSESEPARALQRALGTSVGGLQCVERRPGVLDFAAKQVAMQARKRLRA